MNENEKTVYLDCLNEPRCLAAARFYKKAKQFYLLGNHAAEICPPDEKMKTKIHFEEFLKKDVIEKENAAVSVLNVYKRAVENRYDGIWLPENHRQLFLPILRRIRYSHKSNDSKPKKAQRNAIEMCDAATSYSPNFSPTQKENPVASTSTNPSVATMPMQPPGINENVCIQIFIIPNGEFLLQHRTQQLSLRSIVSRQKLLKKMCH